MQLRRQVISTPITALAFLNPVGNSHPDPDYVPDQSARTAALQVLAAEGTMLELFSTTTMAGDGDGMVDNDRHDPILSSPPSQRLVATLPCFADQAVHGIVTRGDRALVWGGCHVGVLQVSTAVAEAGTQATRAAADRECGGGVGHAEKGSQDTGSGHGSQQELLKMIAQAEAHDRILDGAWSPQGNGRFALVTAHNEVVFGRVEAAESIQPAQHSKLQVLHLDLGALIVSPSRPLLYAARIAWTKGFGYCDHAREQQQDRLIVAAGTIFGEIVVWTCTAYGKEGGAPSVLHVLTGHEGSVFGVDVSPELTVGAKHCVHNAGNTEIRSAETEEAEVRTAAAQPRLAQIQLLASCSDDRTVRVWDISQHATAGVLVPSQLVDARETGFGDNLEQQQAVKYPLAVAEMAHKSRVWKVRFGGSSRIVNSDSSGEELVRLTLFSFGEDATAHRWHVDVGGRRDGGPLLTATIVRVATYALHSGKHVWAEALLPQAFARDFDLVATGGADGRVALISGVTGPTNATELAMFGSCEPVEVTLEDALNAVVPGSGGAAKAETAACVGKRDQQEVVGRCVFLSPSMLVSMSTAGRAPLRYCFVNKRWSRAHAAKRNSLPEFFGRDFVLAGDPHSGCAFLGTASGDIYWCREDFCWAHLAHVNDKMLGLWYLGKHDNVAWLLVSLKNLTTCILRFTYNSMNEGEQQLLEEKIIQPPERFLVTAVLMKDRHHLVMGSRHGNLLVYRRVVEDASWVRVCQTDIPVCNDAITSIVSVPGDWSAAAPGPLLTTSRDGMYRIFLCDDAEATDGSSLGLKMVHESSVPFGPMVEAAWFQPRHVQGNPFDLMVCGFKGVNFVVWNMTEGRSVASIHCGGGHRSFAYAPSTNPMYPDAVRFAFIKASTLHVYSQVSAGYRIMQAGGGHGREISAACRRADGLVATGAEDTIVRLWRQPGQGHANIARVVAAESLGVHTTGIQCVRFDDVAGRLYTSGGNEEFFIWAINPSGGLTQIGRLSEEHKSTAGDLRIVDFCVDQETHRCSARVTMALSNSTIKVYRHGPDGAMALLANVVYTGACISRVLTSRPATPDGRFMTVLSSATDGYIAVWLLSLGTSTGDTCAKTQTPVLMYQLHQSCIMTLAHLPIADDRGSSQQLFPSGILATGGDDNAIGLSVLSSSGTTFAVRKLAYVPRAHAATVTGVVLSSAGEELQSPPTTCTLVSIGRDQRVKVWKVLLSKDWDIKVMLLKNAPSAIADPAGMIGYTCNNQGRSDLEAEAVGTSTRRNLEVLVYGAGMEKWTLE